MSYKILGIEIERKTDILAFAAFVISLGGLTAQVINFVKGSDVQLKTPSQILISSKPKKQGHYTLMSAKLAYFNNGSPGYNDVTKSEDIYFTIGHQNIHLTAQNYIATEDKEGKLITTKISDADPVQIKSGDLVVHETHFYPWPSKTKDKSKNFIQYSEFIRLLKKQPELIINFKIKTYKNKKFNFSCKLITQDFIIPLEQKGWSAPVCQ